MAQLSTKEINRNKLLDQGVLMLTEQGYHGTGLKEILDVVKIPKGSFYNYFASKEEYCAEIIFHYIEPFLQRLTIHLQAPELNALVALKKYYDELIDELAQSDFKGGCLLGNLMGEIGGTSEICKDSLIKAVDRYSNIQEIALVRGQEEGVVRKDRSAKSMADLLINNWQGALLRMKIERSVLPLKECCTTLLEDYFKA
ncbi:MAG: TetR family transcriptional regulator C-terminal domain-containing protein [Methylococcales bacterium]|nr:TetR family transcriptional regulator C-terminal domain-containing protein [Methylococcales bacterium]